MTVRKRIVYSQPKFLEKLGSVKVNLGENVSLSVKAAGNPTPDLTWLKVIAVVYAEYYMIMILHKYVKPFPYSLTA